MSIRCVPLGAGQDVGRSCLILSIGGKNIMLDCGMHMGYQDNRRFPDFSYLSKSGNFNAVLDCIIISHFHLDHCGALPYFTEICGYDGPIYMTTPTRAIAPILLDDMRKVVAERKGDPNFFTSQEIRACLEKVVSVSLHETVQVDQDLKIKAYYAGHVLGAAMFHIQVGELSVVYTGDYNMTPDRHLGAAWIDECKPDLLITETTYATTTRASKRSRELDFLQQVHECVLKGGKVLIPVFALGRAQELCILIDSYWAQTGLKAPIYYSAGLTERANEYYKLFIGWTNEKIKSTFSGGGGGKPGDATSNASSSTNSHNMFDFKHIQPFDRTYADEPGPMVLFASPGMLHAGQSLDVFKRWCGDPKNMIIMPGYCVAGTVGAKVLAGERVVEVDKMTRLQVNLQVKNLSFSAHADSKGILQLIGMCKPKHVMLVHGEAHKMSILKHRIENECKIPCFDPANGTCITLYGHHEHVSTILSQAALDRAYQTSTHLQKQGIKRMQGMQHTHAHAVPSPVTPFTNLPAVPFAGAVVLDHTGTKESIPRLMDRDELRQEVGVDLVQVSFRIRKEVNVAAMVVRHEALLQQQQFQAMQQQQDHPHQQHKSKKARVQAAVTPNDAVLQPLITALKVHSAALKGAAVFYDKGNGIVRVGWDVRIALDEARQQQVSNAVGLGNGRGTVVVEWNDVESRDLATIVLSVVSATLQ
ncbi:Integrator complex subunit 11 [Chytriomyces hyalinus]|nr:Integrator complex subunit 11 [Chytriomyces hyalinus]